VHRIVAAETGNRTEAEDLTQEAFARVLPRLATFVGEGALSAYLDQVARNLVRDRRRRRRFHSDAGVEDRPTDRPGPEAEALHGLDRANVRAAMRRLPPDYQRVLRPHLDHRVGPGRLHLAAIGLVPHRRGLLGRRSGGGHSRGGGDVRRGSQLAAAGAAARRRARGRVRGIDLGATAHCDCTSGGDGLFDHVHGAAQLLGHGHGHDPSRSRRRADRRDQRSRRVARVGESAG
jgi:RNA polymerase sigma factor (sigma-70 family)